MSTTRRRNPIFGDLKKKFTENSQGLSKEIAKSTMANGVSLLVMPISMKSKKYAPDESKKANGNDKKLTDAGNITIEVFVSSIKGTVVPGQEGKVYCLEGGIYCLELYGKHKVRLSADEQDGQRKWKYIPDREKTLKIEENTTFFVSWFVSAEFTKAEAAIKAHCERSGKVMVTGISPIIYWKKERQGDQTDQQVPPLPNQDGGGDEGGNSEGEEGHEEGHPQQDNFAVAEENSQVQKGEPRWGLNVNAKSVTIVESQGEDPYCVLASNTPPFSRLPIPQITTPPPDHETVEKLLRERYGDNSTKYNSIRDGLWRKSMPAATRGFYRRTGFFEIGPLECNTFSQQTATTTTDKPEQFGIERIAYEHTSLEKLPKDAAGSKELKLQSVGYYSQWYPGVEPGEESFYITYSLNQELCHKLLRIANPQLWQTIVTHHVPNAAILGWIDVGDVLDRAGLCEKFGLKFGIKLVPKKLVPGLVYYVVTRGFLLPIECVREWMYYSNGRTPEDDGGIVEMTDIPVEVTTIQHNLNGADPTIRNVFESQKSWRCTAASRDATTYDFYALVGADFSESFEIYLSWGERKSEIIASVLSGKCYGSVKQDELKTYSEQFGFTASGPHVATKSVVYAVKRTAVADCLKMAADGRKQCSYVAPELTPEEPSKVPKGECDTGKDPIGRSSEIPLDSDPKQNTPNLQNTPKNNNHPHPDQLQDSETQKNLSLKSQELPLEAEEKQPNNQLTSQSEEPQIEKPSNTDDPMTLDLPHEKPPSHASTKSSSKQRSRDQKAHQPITATTTASHSASKNKAQSVSGAKRQIDPAATAHPPPKRRS